MTIEQIARNYLVGKTISYFELTHPSTRIDAKNGVFRDVAAKGWNKDIENKIEGAKLTELKNRIVGLNRLRPRSRKDWRYILQLESGDELWVELDDELTIVEEKG